MTQSHSGHLVKPRLAQPCHFYLTEPCQEKFLFYRLFLNNLAKIKHLQRINLNKTEPNRRAIIEVNTLHSFDTANACLCSYFPANNDISLICTHKATGEMR